MLGPVDYIVVGFRGNKFDGSIVDELAKAVEAGIIRIVDLVFIMKDTDGNVEVGEYADQAPELKEAFGDLAVSANEPLFSEEDIEKVAGDMDKDTAAGVLVLEHLWAKGLKKALMDAGGVLIAEGRIHPELVEAVERELATADK